MKTQNDTQMQWYLTTNKKNTPLAKCNLGEYTIYIASDLELYDIYVKEDKNDIMFRVPGLFDTSLNLAMNKAENWLSLVNLGEFIRDIPVTL